MKSQPFSFQLNKPQGAQLKRVKLSPETVEQLKQVTGKHPREYLREFIDNDDLFNKLEAEISRCINEAIPENPDCAFCRGESTNELDKACWVYKAQMNFTYNIALYELVSIVLHNRHIFKDKKYLRRLSAHFATSFAFVRDHGIMWFDLPKFEKLLLEEGFLSLALQFEESQLNESLRLINNTLNSIDDQLVIEELYGRGDPNYLRIQHQFFSGKMRYYETKKNFEQNESKQQKATNSDRPNRTDIALYCYYLSTTGTNPTEAIFPSVAGWKELEKRFDKNYKNIQQRYNEINTTEEKRISCGTARNIKFVMDNLLTEHSAALRLAQSEYQLALLK